MIKEGFDADLSIVDLNKKMNFQIAWLKVNAVGPHSMALNLTVGLLELSLMETKYFGMESLLVSLMVNQLNLISL